MSGFDGISGDLRNLRLLGEREAQQLRPQQDSAAPGEDFGTALVDAMRGVDELSRQSDATAAALYRGEPVELHDLMIAMGKSEVAFNLMLEVRNKLVEAWQTLSRSVV